MGNTFEKFFLFLGIKSSFAMFLHLVSWGFCEVDKLSPARIPPNTPLVDKMF